VVLRLLHVVSGGAAGPSTRQRRQGMHSSARIRLKLQDLAEQRQVTRASRAGPCLTIAWLAGAK